MATATLKSAGISIDYTPDTDISTGDVVVIGELVTVATTDIDEDDLGSVLIEGVVDFPKATTSSSAITAGAKVYWDASGEVVTTTADSNKTAGYAVEDAADATAVIAVKLAR